MNDEQTTGEVSSPQIMDETPTESTPTELVSFGEMYSGSFKAVIKRPGLIGAVFVSFAAITIAGVIGSFGVVGYLLAAFTSGTLSMTVLILLLLIGVILYMLWIAAYIAAATAIMRSALLRNEKVGYWNSFAWSIKHIWPIFMIGLYIQLTTITGYMFLIIPGIALSLYTAYSMFVFVGEDIRGINALMRSIDLVKGKFWGMFWRAFAFSFSTIFSVFVPVFVLAMISIAISPVLIALVPVIVLALYPFMIIWILFGFTMLFESAQKRKPLTQFDSSAHPRLRKVLIAAAILGVPILLVWNGFSIYNEVVKEQSATTGTEVPALFNLQSL